jgi:hypothetical protein
VARRLLLAAGALLLILSVVFFLIPVWISNDQGRAYVLDRVNARLKGPRITIDKWSLSWFGATTIQNFRVLEPDGTPMVSCPHISSGLTLWDLVWSNYDVGNTTADNLEIRIQKNADGTTSMDSFAADMADALRSARGALQINGGKLALVSARSGQSLQYRDLRASIGIASPQAPFRAQISAVSGANAALSLNATFPPTQTLNSGSLRSPAVWRLVEDISISAQRVPAAMACDFLRVDPAWVDSFGDTLETISFTGRASPVQSTARLTVRIAGLPQKGEATSLDLAVQLDPPEADGRGAALLVRRGDPEARAAAALHYSAPLARLLCRLNPILGEATSADDGLVRVGATFELPLDHPAEGTAALRLEFPPLVFVPRDGPSTVRQFQVVTGELPRPSENQRVTGEAGALRATLEGGRFSYTNFLVTLGKTRINFSGSVGAAGTLELVAALPDKGSGLTAGASRVTISGSVETPLVKRAE